MARVTHVKSAQKRYGTRPVIDPETGQQKRVPMMRNGVQMTSKRGPKFLRITERDLENPLPNLRCDFPGCTIDGGEILPGTGYKWIKPKSGPYGGHQKNRHAQHPSWQVWDYSYSMSATLARIAHDAQQATDGAETPDDFTSALEQAAQEIRDLAEQKRESAQNIEDGFGHSTYQSEELNETADALETWADEVEQADVPEPEDYACANCDEGQADCDACQGSGKDPEDDAADCIECEDGKVECPECDGTGLDSDAWLEAAQEALSVLDECPV